MNIVKLADGVEGCFIRSDKFKTSSISINMFIPADEKEVSAYSLLSLILTAITADYPDYTSLNRVLNELYSSALIGDVYKFGDMRMVKFTISSIDDKFTLFGEKISEKAVELLLSAVLNPPFDTEAFKNELKNSKRVLIDQINSEINDKRSYAVSKTESIMYDAEPAGFARYGTVEAVEALSVEDLKKAHRDLINNSFIRVNVVSQSEPNSVFDKISDYFGLLNRNVKKENLSVYHKTVGELKKTTEKMDVTQAKLCMGFSLDVGNTRFDVAKAAVFVDIFGGGPYSKLFTVVREKLSLCYYCTARFNSRKGTFIVDSGILEEMYEKAYNGILEQLESIKKGDFDEELLNSSKLAITDSLVSVNDKMASLDNWYALNAFNENETLETYAELINKVTISDVIAVADSVKLDTVYFLGKGEEK